MRQLEFKMTNWQHRLSYGGQLRQKRIGRGTRPLSKEPIHLVFKANKEKIRGGFRTPRRFKLIYQILEKYRRKFYINVEQISVQGDHMHLCLRTTRRTNHQRFFRVFAGQIAQQFEKEGLLTMASVTGTQAGRRLAKSHTAA